jgi:hypothetical protein
MKTLLLATLVLFQYAAATQLHVYSNQGSFRTIQSGLNAMNSGDTVIVHAGTYAEALTWKKSGLIGKPSVLMSALGDSVYVTGTTIGSDSPYLLIIRDHSHLIVQGLVFQDFTPSYRPFPNWSVWGGGMLVTGSGQNIQILGNLFRRITAANDEEDNVGTLRVWSSGNGNGLKNLLVRNNRFEDNTTANSEVCGFVGRIDSFQVISNVALRNETNPVFQCGGGYDLQFLSDAITNTDVPKNGLFFGNTASDNGPRSLAYYADGCQDIRFVGNFARRNAAGFTAQSEEVDATTKRIRFEENLLVDNFFGIGVGRDPYYDSLFPGRKPGLTDSILIANNTVIRSYNALDLGRAKNIEVINNLFVLEHAEFDARFSTWKDSLTNLWLDFNQYWGQDGSFNGKWDYEGKTYEGLVAFKQGTGFEKNGGYAEPTYDQDHPDSLFCLQSRVIGAPYSRLFGYLPLNHTIGYCTPQVPIQIRPRELPGQRKSSTIFRGTLKIWDFKGRRIAY